MDPWGMGPRCHSDNCEKQQGVAQSEPLERKLLVVGDPQLGCAGSGSGGLETGWLNVAASGAMAMKTTCVVRSWSARPNQPVTSISTVPVVPLVHLLESRLSCPR
jgi:hypothetical protein